MSADERKLSLRSDWLVAATLMAAGTAMVAVSIAEIRSSPPAQLAQSTPEPQKDIPAESKPGGTRPTTPAPEPARPDPHAQKAGAQPVLPPAPAEKTGTPIKEK